MQIQEALRTGCRRSVNDAYAQTLRRCIERYFAQGERSPQKLVPIHSFVNRCVSTLLGSEYNVISYMENDKQHCSEERVKGLFYDKNVDVAIKKGERVVGVVSVKFVMSNYGQNSNNYFESVLGECQNLKLANPDLVFWYFFVTFERIPYFTRDRTIKSWNSYVNTIVDKHSKQVNLPEDAKKTSVDLTSVTFLDISSLEADWSHPSKYKGDIPLERCLLSECAQSLDWMDNLYKFVDLVRRRQST